MWRKCAEIITIFCGNVRPLPDPILLYVLEYAGLVRVGSRFLTYQLFFPRLVQRKNEPVE